MNNHQIFSKSNVVKVFLILPLIAFAFMVSAEVSRVSAKANAPEVNETNAMGRDENAVTQLKRFNKQDVEIFENQRDSMKEIIEQKRENHKKQFDMTKERVKEEIEQKREELKTRLADIKDERKKKVTEKINEQIVKLNERITEHFLSALYKMEEILRDINSRADKAQAHGADVLSVRTLIADALTEIGEARMTVTGQAGMVYDINITTEDNLKADILETRKLFREHLGMVRDAVKKAHTAVRDAAVSLAQIQKIDEYEVEEESSSQNN